LGGIKGLLEKWRLHIYPPRNGRIHYWVKRRIFIALYSVKVRIARKNVVRTKSSILMRDKYAEGSEI